MAIYWQLKISELFKKALLTVSEPIRNTFSSLSVRLVSLKEDNLLDECKRELARIET